MSWFQSEHERVAGELQSLHAEYRRLVRQLESHAEAAPYPQITERLQTILRDEDRSAQAIAERLDALGRHLRDEDAGAIKSGHNSWARLVVLLEDYRALLRRLSALWVQWDDEHPEDAKLVRDLRDSAIEHREAIVDLVARADPHASN